MGNDGGSIPKRRELVKEAARQPTSAQLKETAAESLTHAWTTCPLSSEPLDAQNTVADGRGILYNYESVLQCLLPSSADDVNGIPEAQEEAFRHAGITSARDIVRLRFALRRDDRGREVRACPVSLKELGAATKAVYLVPCGHVFAEAALRELAESASASAAAAAADAEDDDAKRCPECSEPFEPTNVIPVLPTTEAETAKLNARLEALKARGLAHNLKKDKSASKKKRKAADDGAADGEKPGPSKKEKREKERGSGIGSRINNSATASLTARVLAEQEESNKRRKLAAAR